MANGNWWETSDGDHIEPIGGALAGLGRISGHETDFSRAIDSHRDLTFGNGDKPGILGTGRFQGSWYAPASDASQIPGAAGLHAAIQQGYNGSQARGPSQMQGGYIDPRMQDQTRGQQGSLAALLQQRAMGTGGPSAAELQMQRGLDSNMSQAMSMAASQRGQNAGGGMRAMMQQRAQLGQQGIADAGVLRAQEQMGAQNSLGQLLTGMRGQDIGMATGQAQLDQSTNQSNLAAKMQQKQMNDQMTQYYMTQGMTLAQAQQQAAMDMERLRVQQNIAEQQLKDKAYNDSAQANTNLVKGVVSMINPMMGMGGGGK